MAVGQNQQSGHGASASLATLRFAFGEDRDTSGQQRQAQRTSCGAASIARWLGVREHLPLRLIPHARPVRGRASRRRGGRPARLSRARRGGGRSRAGPPATGPRRPTGVRRSGRRGAGDPTRTGRPRSPRTRTSSGSRNSDNGEQTDNSSAPGDNGDITGDQGSWVLVAKFDAKTGKLSLDESFHEPGATALGVSFDRQEWPHGKAGRAIVHGALFGPQ